MKKIEKFPNINERQKIIREISNNTKHYKYEKGITRIEEDI
jgi:hypothetical protein